MVCLVLSCLVLSCLVLSCLALIFMKDADVFVLFCVGAVLCREQVVRGGVWVWEVNSGSLTFKCFGVCQELLAASSILSSLHANMCRYW